MRFSLKTLLAVSTALCVYVAIVFAVPPMLGFACILLVQFLMPSVVIAGVLYSRRAWKAFFVGVAVAGFVPMLAGQWYLLMMTLDGFDTLADDLFDTSGGDDLRQILYACAFFHVALLLSGIAAVTMRSIFASSRPLVGASCLD